MSTVEGDWELLAEIAGDLQAELIKGLLNAQEIEAVLFQEGAGKVHGLTVGPLGKVQIFVPRREISRARALMASYADGSIEASLEEDREDLSDG